VRQIELLRFVVEVLDRLGIRYAVVGLYASGAWGEPRMTRDIDIVIDLPMLQADSLCGVFPDDEFYVSRAAAIEAVHQRSQFNVIHPKSGNKIDFMIAKSDEWSAAQLSRRKLVAFEADTRGYVATPEDVILGKLMCYLDGGSEKHLRDIAGVMNISGETLDRTYITRFAGQFGAGDVWRAILERVDHSKSED